MFREIQMTQVKEVLRRWQAGQGVREITRQTQLDRKTVRRYVDAAVAEGIGQDSELSDEGVAAVTARVQVRPLPEPSESWQQLVGAADKLRGWLAKPKPLRLTKVQRLLAREGIEVSYATLWRFVQRELGLAAQEVTVRLSEPPPGEEAQIDFGKVGQMLDATTGRVRALWVLVVTLSFSRMMFVWPTFVQTTAALCEGLDAAWRFFKGIPKRGVIDNTKAAVAKADALSPVLTAAFLEYAQARGLFIDPARVRRPRDKAKVENGVQYTRENWFRGEELAGLEEARQDAERWCAEVAGRRVHGTTGRVPIEVLEEQERACLSPPPDKPFDVPEWVDAKVHGDHHIQVARGLYSAPTRYVGKRVKVKVDKTTVRIYFGSELIKLHPRVAPGGRSTDVQDYPTGKEAYALRNVDRVREHAYGKGKVIGQFVERLLDISLPWTRMRQAYALLRFCDKYGSDKVEVACQRAMEFDVLDVRRIERIVKQAISKEDSAQEQGKLARLPAAPPRFARPQSAFQTRPAEVAS